MVNLQQLNGHHLGTDHPETLAWKAMVCLRHTKLRTTRQNSHETPVSVGRCVKRATWTSELARRDGWLWDGQLLEMQQTQ